jgi:hypothetical protein
MTRAKKNSLFNLENPENHITVRFLFILIFSLNISLLFGQEKKEMGLISYREEAEKMEDETDEVRVNILDEVDNPHCPHLVIVNGKACPSLFGDTMLMSHLELIQVRKGDTIVNNVKYYGKIYITIKEGYDFNLVSLNFVKGKYTKLKDQPVVFLVNGNIIKDPDDYFMDENLIRQVTIGKLKSPDMSYVDISTKN